MLFELISSIFKNGWVLTVAGVCIGLYIDGMVRGKVADKDNARKESDDKATDAKTQKILETILGTEQEILSAIKSVSISLLNVAEQGKTLSAQHHDIQSSLNIIIQDVKAVNSNQLASASGLHRIVEKLIDSMKD